MMSESIFKMGLQNLQNEPLRLEKEASRINEELESLVMDNYRIFVENLSCSVQLRAEGRQLDDSRGNLRTDLKELMETCRAFKDKVTNIVNMHKRNRKTLQHHMQLVELLEVPQLVDACARNGFYDEALELANFVNGLERRHLLVTEIKPNDKSRSGNNVVQSIVDDSFKILSSLRIQLLQLLTEDIALPQELQILGTLRKLDTLLIDRKLSLERHVNDKLSSMSDSDREKLRKTLLSNSETRLQMDFLETRTIWLKKQVDRHLSNLSLKVNENSDSNKHDHSDGNSSLGSYGKAIEMLEVNRTAWFSIITQFNALFGDSKDSSQSPCNILGIWITKQVSKLLSQLELILPQIESGSSMRSILEQTVYFSTRMKEIGCDFTTMALPMFSSNIIGHVKKNFASSIDQFKKIILSERMIIDNEDFPREQIVPLYLKQDDQLEDPVYHKKNYDEIIPPQAIFSYPPIAYLLNSLLQVFNYIRDCPMTTVKLPIFHELKTLIYDAVEFLVENSPEISKKSAKFILSTSSKLSKTSSVHNDILVDLTLEKRYAVVFSQHFLPHILMSFESLFPHNNNFDVKSFTSVKVKRGNELREVIGKELFSIFQHCWDRFIKMGLLPIEVRGGNNNPAPVVSHISHSVLEPEEIVDNAVAVEQSSHSENKDVFEICSELEKSADNVIVQETKNEVMVSESQTISVDNISMNKDE